MTRKGWLIMAGIVMLGTGVVSHHLRTLPDGLSWQGPPRVAENLAYFEDDTSVDADGQRLIRQQIFDEALRLIGQAERLVVVDLFLYNDFQGEPPETHRALSRELTEALIRRKQEVPALQAVVITDPFNQLYGGLSSPWFQALRTAGIPVVETRLTALPDSNPSWSLFWRLLVEPFGNSADGGWLPNPVGPGKVTLRSYLALLNFKANHRKTLVVDEGDTWTAMVMSANPHDGSSAHSNVAVRFSGAAALDLMQTEAAVLRFSWSEGGLPDLPSAPPAEPTATTDDATVQVITEGRIRDALLQLTRDAETGDRLLVKVFYLSYQPLLQALIEAHGRGVPVQVILDPNKDAFGREKNGIPNRQVAHALHQAGIPVRWCNTSGEQCHGKVLMRVRADGQVDAVLGSANFTRRNLDDLNLETNVQLRLGPDQAVAKTLLEHFDRDWNNDDGRIRTLHYDAYADPSLWRRGLYRFMEATGWSSF